MHAAANEKTIRRQSDQWEKNHIYINIVYAFFPFFCFARSFAIFFLFSFTIVYLLWRMYNCEREAIQRKTKKEQKSKVAIEQQIRMKTDFLSFFFCRWFALFWSSFRFNRVSRSIWFKHNEKLWKGNSLFFHSVFHSRNRKGKKQQQQQQHKKDFHCRLFCVICCISFCYVIVVATVLHCNYTNLCLLFSTFTFLCFDNFPRWKKKARQQLRAEKNYEKIREAKKKKEHQIEVMKQIPGNNRNTDILNPVDSRVCVEYITNIYISLSWYSSSYHE